MLANAADGEVGGAVIAVRQGQGIARSDAQRFGHLLGHDHALLPQRDLFAGDPLMQVGKIGKAVRILGDHQVNIHLAVRAVLPGGFHRNGQRFNGVVGVIKVIVDGAALGGLLLGDDRQQVIVENFAVLLGDDGVQRIRDAKARHQQRGAAGYTDDRHPETLFVAQQVAAGDLPAKGQPPPQRGDALQQDALAGLGGAGQHQGGGILLQGGAAGQRCDADRQHDKGAACKKCLPQPPRCGDGRHVVHHRICGPDDGRERLEPDRQPEHRARCRRRKGVEQILLHDGCVRIAERLQGADLQALLLDHAGHRR